MNILVTGVAGFIGAQVAKSFLDAGYRVFGIDNVNNYYDTGLKEYRLAQLEPHPNFRFCRLDLSDSAGVNEVFSQYNFDIVVHLAAQAGVRYSIENPHAYINSNILGFQNILDNCREHPPRHLVFASSSSVYGNSAASEFNEAECTDDPVSLYAATKKSNEVIAHSYAKLYGIPTTGLRFFTVYGPAGRPDMAYFSFTKAIISGQPIRVFNHGQLWRDFTYIDDIVDGVRRVCNASPADLEIPYRILNLGHNQPVKLEHFINTLEVLLGRQAVKEYIDMQAGDVLRTCANIDGANSLVGYAPGTNIETGLERFVGWYRTYFHV